MRKSGERASLTKGSAESDPSADGRPEPEAQNPARILGFKQDEEGHWVAVLSCGHTQHLRHQPPWQNRDWVQDPLRRQAHIGQPFTCGWCAQGQEPLHEDGQQHEEQ